MCNACGFLCCASDVFARCGCDCDNPECWDIDEDEYDEPDQGFICLPCHAAHQN